MKCPKGEPAGSSRGARAARSRSCLRDPFRVESAEVLLGRAVVFVGAHVEYSRNLALNEGAFNPPLAESSEHVGGGLFTSIWPHQAERSLTQSGRERRPNEQSWHVVGVTPRVRAGGP